MQAAQHLHISGDAQKLLTNDESTGVRCKLAGNSNALSKYLDVLSMDESKHVREKVAGNPSTYSETLTSFWKDTSRMVRERAYENPNASFKTKVMLFVSLVVKGR